MATLRNNWSDPDGDVSVGAVTGLSRGLPKRTLARSRGGVQSYSLSQLATIVDLVEIELRIESVRRAAAQAYDELRRVTSDLEALTQALPHTGRGDRGRALLAMLTRQERRIALLAADGLSNLEIAAEIDISAETVRGHLKGVSRKLGIHSRWELAHLLSQSGKALTPSL